jgi:hypothetical protein
LVAWDGIEPPTRGFSAQPEADPKPRGSNFRTPDCETIEKESQRSRNHRATIVTSLQYGLSNARVESVNTRIRLLTRIAFGFHSAGPLIAMVLLALGGLCPPLPGRS